MATEETKHDGQLELNNLALRRGYFTLQVKQFRLETGRVYALALPPKVLPPDEPTANLDVGQVAGLERSAIIFRCTLKHSGQMPWENVRSE